MNVLSVCSGIGAAELAFGRCGMTTVASAEIEAFPSAVLAERFPSVPNLGDMNGFRDWSDFDIDLLVGGTPCQSFSVAGLRQGLADPRGNLTLVYCAIAERYRPAWLVWENVPGILSSNGGRDFGAFLGALAQLGYGWAYRILDAQYFGVPQRRRRVFVVGHLGDWRRAASVLFERESLQGHPPPRREAGEVAPTTPARSSGGGGLGTDFDCDDGLSPSQQWPASVAPTINAHFGDKMGLEDQHALTGSSRLFVPVAFNSREDPVSGPIAGALGSSSPQAQTVAFSCKDHGADALPDMSPTLRAMGHAGSHPNAGGQVAVAYDMRGREGGARMEGPHDTANIRASSGGSSRSYVIQERAVSENPDAGPDGAGFREGAAYTLEGRARVTSPGNYSNPKPGDPCHPLAAGAHPPAVAHALRAEGFDASEDGTGRGTPIVPTLAETIAGLRAEGLTLKEAQALGRSYAVRRLMPVECERLQGFPDNFTAVTYRNKPAADGPRYKALGNSMAVPVMEWIGRRIVGQEMLA